MEEPYPLSFSPFDDTYLDLTTDDGTPVTPGFESPTSGDVTVIAKIEGNKEPVLEITVTSNADSVTITAIRVVNPADGKIVTIDLTEEGVSTFYLFL